MIEKRTICITGARTALNNGTLSIIASGMEEINRLSEIPIHFFILSPNKNIDEPIYRKTINNIDFEVIGSNFHPNIPYSLILIYSILLSIPCYLKSDVIVDMRGEGYVNDSVAIVQSFQMLLANILFTPFIIYAQSIGPFKTGLNRFLARMVFSRAKLITLREPVSMDYYNQLHLTKKAVLCADQAIMLTPVSPIEANTILKNVFGYQPKKIIGISPIPNERITKIFCELIDYVSEKYCIDIIIIPHAIDEHFGGCKGNDDMQAAISIFSQIKNTDNVRIIEEKYIGRQLKGLMKCCNVYITARWHAGIASTSALTPSIIISSAHKSAAISMIDMDEFLLNPQKITSQELIEKFDKIWDNNQQVREKLDDEIKKILPLAALSAQMTFDSIYLK